MEKKNSGKAMNPKAAASPQKQLQAKKELQIKKEPHAEALKKASEEVVAKAIHDMLLKDK